MRAYVGLGANLNEPAERIREAIGHLDGPDVRVQRRGSMVCSPPVGPPDQPDFVNTVIEVETSVTPHGLWARCQGVERTMGRVKTRRWGERVIDLDVILFEARVIDSPDLTVPHPQALQRSFVMRPLADLIPDASFPGRRGRMADLAAACTTPPLRTLDPAVRTRQELGL